MLLQKVVLMPNACVRVHERTCAHTHNSCTYTCLTLMLDQDGMITSDHN